jgi:AraC family cel operon transcriptional repressor
LTERQTSDISDMLNRLNTLPVSDKRLIRSTLRILLVEMYFKYLPMIRRERKNPLPRWLEKLYEDMKKKEVFVPGVSEMVRLTGKNHSYLCRAFKQHLGTTPTTQINKLRLNYAENLLLNSDLSILDICLETGFESLSHFYRLFERQYAMTPYKYRKKYWNSLHRWS